METGFPKRGVNPKPYLSRKERPNRSGRVTLDILLDLEGHSLCVCVFAIASADPLNPLVQGSSTRRTGDCLFIQSNKNSCLTESLKRCVNGSSQFYLSEDTLRV